MFYIYKEKEVFKFLEIKKTTDATYHELKRAGYDIQGQFGRKLYAQIHVDFRNGKITDIERDRALETEFY